MLWVATPSRRRSAGQQGSGPRGGQCDSCYLRHTYTGGRSAGEAGGRQCIQIVARAKASSNGSSRLPRVEQQLRGLATAILGVRDLGSHHVQPSPAEFIQWSPLCDTASNSSAASGAPACCLASAATSERVCPPPLIGCQHRSMFQEGRGGGQAPAGLRSSCGSLEFGGDLFARFGSTRALDAMLGGPDPVPDRSPPPVHGGPRGARLTEAARYVAERTSG